MALSSTKLAVATLLVLLHAEALAVVSLVPLRVHLSSRERTKSVSVRNPSDQPAKYKVAVVFVRVTERGNFQEEASPTPDERSASKFIRATPRTVTLPPKGEQVVRVMAMPTSMPDGEYRAHLKLEPVADEPEETGKSKKAVKAGLTLMISVSIPIFYRTGNISSTADIKGAKLIAGAKPTLAIAWNQRGNGFTHGDLHVWLTPTGGKLQKLAVVPSITVYQSKGIFQYILNLEKDAKIAPGTLKVELRESSDREPADAEGKVLASFEGPYRPGK